MSKKLKLNIEDIEQLLKNGFIDEDKKFHQFAYLTYVDDEYIVCDLKNDTCYDIDKIFIVKNHKITIDEHYSTTIDLKNHCYAIFTKTKMCVCNNAYDLIKSKKRLFIVDDKFAYELDDKVVESVNSSIREYKKSGI
jgi:hypothetical protein